MKFSHFQTDEMLNVIGHLNDYVIDSKLNNYYSNILLGEESPYINFVIKTSFHPFMCVFLIVRVLIGYTITNNKKKKY